MPLLTVRHATTYRYRHPVSFGEHRMMFRPRDSHDQRLIRHDLTISPEPTSLRWSQDVFGNSITHARFHGRAETLSFVNTLEIDHTDSVDPSVMLSAYARQIPFAYDADEMPDLLRSIERQYHDGGHIVDQWARSLLDDHGPTPTVDLLAAMTKAIRHRFNYVARYSPGIQDPQTTMRLETGTCRDFALLMMEAVRSLGMAARFVSGYLHVPRRTHNGASERQGGGNTHAWLQVYLPGAGWIDYDPTNGIVGSRGLIRVSVVRDPAMAVPLSGSWTGASADCLGMDVSVEVSEKTALLQPIR